MEENLSLENLSAEEIWEKLYTYKKSGYATIRINSLIKRAAMLQSGTFHNHSLLTIHH